MKAQLPMRSEGASQCVFAFVRRYKQSITGHIMFTVRSICFAVSKLFETSVPGQAMPRPKRYPRRGPRLKLQRRSLKLRRVQQARPRPRPRLRRRRLRPMARPRLRGRPPRPWLRSVMRRVVRKRQRRRMRLKM